MSTAALKAVATDSQEKNPVVAFRGFLEKQKHQLAAALPKHISPDRMIRLACTEFAKNPLLQKCTPVSVFGAIIQASQLGLEIGVLGQAYLVPYRNNRQNTYEAQFIPGYKGLIALARRSGEVTSIETHIVYEREVFVQLSGWPTPTQTDIRPGAKSAGKLRSMPGGQRTERPTTLASGDDTLSLQPNGSGISAANTGSLRRSMPSD